MPFDGVDIYALRREILVSALRAEDEFPKGFKWNFERYFFKELAGCGSAGCAIGLMHLIFDDFAKPPAQDSSGRTYNRAAAYLGIPLWEAKRCFEPGAYLQFRVTPSDVADRLAAINHKDG